MTDAVHLLGSDFSIGSNGDIALCDGADERRQDILRRLCTNPDAYVWHHDYGAGIGAQIGQPRRDGDLEAIIRAQLSEEAAVDQTQPVRVSITDLGNGIFSCTITYVDANTGDAQTIQT